VNRHKRTRLQPRTSDGRWIPATTENMFGLRVLVCPECRQCNPYGRKPVDASGPFVDPAAFNTWDVPTHCHACGAELEGEAVG
jgi:hypothetical protein